MSEMVERVARAIYDTGPVGVRQWEDAPASIREDCLVCARAALAALREPTEAMEDAPWRVYPGVQIYEPEDLSQVLDCVSFKRVWQAMVDEALK